MWPTPPRPLQLTAPDGKDAWWAAAWIGINKDDAGQWRDASGPAASVPWCPGEPNYLAQDERCANLMTGCPGAGGAALVNDYMCDKPIRVLCVYESSDCGGRQQELWRAGPGQAHALHAHVTCPSCLASGLLRSGTQPKPPLLPLPPRLACHAAPPPEPLSTCAGSFKVALYPAQGMPRADALAFCKAQHGASATLARGSAAVMAAAQGLVEAAQLAPTEGSNPWTAAAWTGITKHSDRWQDAAGVVASIPWCPAEPNNRDASEACTALLTGCSGSGAALLNDDSCGRALYPLCSVESDECGECWTGRAAMGARCSVRCRFDCWPGCECISSSASE